jgi:hypothetical protein
MLPYFNFRRASAAQILLFFLAVTSIALTLLAPDLLARAGGGESFSSGSSGGSSGGSGSGGGDGAGIILYLIFRLLVVLCVQYPIVGIPLTLAFIALVIYVLSQSQKQLQGRTLQRGLHAISANSQAKAIQTLTNADPSFDPQRFSQRVKTAFLTLQQGWAKQDVSAIRPFSSDGVLERFALQFQEQKDQGYRNQMQDVTIAGVQLAEARIGPIYQSTTLMISASAIDTKVDLKSGKTLTGDLSPEPFVEFWTFVRRPGPAGAADNTAATGGLLEGRCPNCGAAITDASSTPDAAYKCSSCGSALLSGTHDWVLAEISQSTARSTDIIGPDPASITQYQASADPGISVATLEDRASVIFWRWAKTWRTSSIKPLQKVAHPDYCQSVAGLFKSHADTASDTRKFPGRCAVGSVQALGIIPGSKHPASDAPQTDTALVLVEWSATTHSAPIRPKPGAKPTPVPGGGLYCVSLLTLSRKPGVTTNPALGLSSAHCPSCGGPESDATDDSCPFCGSVLNDGSAGWVLTHMQDSTAPGSRALIAQLNAITASGSHQLCPTKSAMALWLASAILADDHVTQREQDLFLAFCQKQGIGIDQAQAILDTAARENHSDHPTVSPLATPEEARAWIALLATSMYASGTPSRDDYHLLLTAAQKLGLSEKDANQANSRARSQALTRARSAIKEHKNAT